MSSLRSELINICIRVSAVGLISYFSLKYIAKFLNPNYALKQEAEKKAEELIKRLDLDFQLELNEYELRIATQLVPPDMGVDFGDIGGYLDIINELKYRVIKPLEAKAHGRIPSTSTLLSPARGILLYGPPGCGKTLLAKAMARSTRARFIQLDLSTLTDKWYGESQKLVAAVFSLAKKVQPCIVFIDEIDAFLRSRMSTDNECSAMMKAQFMSLWDGFSSNNDSIIIMGATNRPNDVDTAILRRMPSRFFVDLPDEKARIAILKTILRNEYIEHDMDYKKIAQMTHGCTGSDLKEICRLAALSRLEEVELPEADVFDSYSIAIRESDILLAINKQSSSAISPFFNEVIANEVD